jgi:septum site-determining protein MinC
MTRSPFRLIGRSILAMALSPEEPLADWFAELDALCEGSPGFFAGRPIILDVAKIDLDAPRLRDLIGKLGKHGLRVMAIEGATAELGPDLPPIVSGARQSGLIQIGGADPDAAGEPAQPDVGLLTIDRPVRSGQTIHHSGDVTIIGSVASGAEIVAGGSIHIYGALRGRALAGSDGNGGARIFCSNFDAELIAVDGLYQTADDVPPHLRSRAVQAWLDGDAIRIAELH